MAKTPKRRPQPQPETHTYAILDRFGVLKGYKRATVAQADAENTGQMPGLVCVPDECDLTIGRYRFDAHHGRFDPLPPADPMKPDLPTDTLRAIWKGFMSLHEAGHEFPEETRAWLAAFGRTIDAKG